MILHRSSIDTHEFYIGGIVVVVFVVLWNSFLNKFYQSRGHYDLYGLIRPAMCTSALQLVEVDDYTVCSAAVYYHRAGKQLHI